MEMLRGLSSDLPTCVDDRIRRRCTAAQPEGCFVRLSERFGNKNQHPKITPRKPRRFSDGPGFPQSELMSQGPTNVGAHWPADQEDVVESPITVYRLILKLEYLTVII